MCIRDSAGTGTQAIEEIVEAARELSRDYTGALVVVERRSGLRQYAETGTRLDARLHRDLLVSLFYGENPLHDGAVLVRGDVVEAARCILPVTQQELPPHLGLRHRAAVGISEHSDALAIVVSEETGSLSLADAGTLRRLAGHDDLRHALAVALGLSVDADADEALPLAPTPDGDAPGPAEGALPVDLPEEMPGPEAPAPDRS